MKGTITSWTVLRKSLAVGVVAAVLMTAASTALWAQNGGAGVDAVRAAIGTLALGEPVWFENLTIFPLSLSISGSKNQGAASSFVTLDEALKKGWLKIRELDDGDVPRLVVDNRGDRPVFIMGGEVVTGGKQDRLIGSDVLIRARARGVEIAVFCVEAGRWTETTAQFITKQNLGTWKLRANAQAGARSATGAYQDLYEDKKVNAQLLALEKDLKNVPLLAGGTVGVLCAVGGRVASVDLFADSSLFERLWPKILRATALSAVTGDAASRITRKDALGFLGQLSDCKLTESRGVDLGIEVRATGGQITAAALVHDGAVLHLAAFPQGRD